MVILGWIFLGEKIDFVQIGGEFFILIGLYYVNFDRNHKNNNNSLNT
jgi:drug/metabolite transporter (DMT)-like permease